MSGTLENLVREFVASVFDKSRARAASTSPKPSQQAETTTAEATRRSNSRAPSTAGTRPSSLVSTSGGNSVSAPRPIRPNITPRGGDWSSNRSSISSPSSARYSTASLATSYRTSIAESATSTTPYMSIPPSHAPSPLAIPFAPSEPVLSSRPSRNVVAASPNPEMQMRMVSRPRQRPQSRTALVQAHGANNPRDSAITDMGCPNGMCLGFFDQKPCAMCGSGSSSIASYFDMDGYAKDTEQSVFGSTDLDESCGAAAVTGSLLDFGDGVFFPETAQSGGTAPVRSPNPGSWD